jgi:hypothetical protein
MYCVRNRFLLSMEWTVWLCHQFLARFLVIGYLYSNYHICQLIIKVIIR